MPMEKRGMGETAPALKSEEAYRIVPSLPSVMTRSIGAASRPALCLRREKDGAHLVARARRLPRCLSGPRRRYGQTRTFGGRTHVG